MSHEASPRRRVGEIGCWNAIGTFGDRSCPELARHVHCRSCPALGEASSALLRRPSTDDERREAAAQVAAPPPQIEATTAVLVFRVGRELLALRAGACAAVVDHVPVRALAGRSGSVLVGLCVLRGELTLAVSLRGLLGATARAEGRTAARWIAIGEEGNRWVFEVDELIGVRAYAPGDVANVPTERAAQVQSHLRAVVRIEGELAGLLDEERLDGAFRRSLAT